MPCSCHFCSCSLVTFYFCNLLENPPKDQNDAPYISKNAEKDAAELIDAYGSYLSLYECLLSAGRSHSKLLVDKLINVAKYDVQHKEAVKALQKAKVLLFYEPVS